METLIVVNILVAILFIIEFFAFIIGLYCLITESDFTIFALFIILFMLTVRLCIMGEEMKNPPKVIEENGYVYQLDDYKPEQTIERYGKTYVLVEE